MFLHLCVLLTSPGATLTCMSACSYVQESLRLAHLPPPPAAPLTPLLSPSGEGRSSKPHPEGPQFSEEDLSDMQSDDEDDQLSRLLQVSVFPGLAVQQDQDLCVLSPAKCGLLLVVTSSTQQPIGQGSRLSRK